MNSTSHRGLRVFNNLELHVTHACNLACESCSHYSNQNHKNNISTEQAESWIRPWHGRIAPEIFSLMGGEPTLHPGLCDFVTLSRAYWPDARIRIVSNGLLLHRHPDLPRVMTEAGNAFLQISIHHHALSFLARLSDNFHMLREWIREYDIDVAFAPSYDNWGRRYKGFGSEMEPYDDGSPEQSWRICTSRWCKQLFEGKIFKCPPLAYLDMQDRKYGLSDSWRPYLQYEPLSPDCSQEALEEFFSRRAEPECAMCPAYERPFRKPIPFPSRAEPLPEVIEELDPFLLFAIGYKGSDRPKWVRRVAKGELIVNMERTDDERYTIRVELQ